MKSQPYDNGSKRLRREVFLLAVIMAAFTFKCPEASAANALEKAIERLQPCQSAKIKTEFGTIGIDKLDQDDD